MISPARLPGVPAIVAALQEGGEHAQKFLGISLTIWQVVNLVLFLAVLVFFVAKPMAAAFRKRQLEVEERTRKTEEQRREVERLSAEIRERTARLETEIESIRRQGVAEGEAARTALAERAREEAARVGREAVGEIERRLLAAKDELRKAAADLTASSAREQVSREITPEDRERLLTESVSRVKATR